MEFLRRLFVFLLAVVLIVPTVATQFAYAVKAEEEILDNLSTDPGKVKFEANKLSAFAFAYEATAAGEEKIKIALISTDARAIVYE